MTENEQRAIIIEKLKQIKLDLLDRVINGLEKAYGKDGYIKMYELRAVIDKVKEMIEND